MTKQITDITLPNVARIAGVGYLIIFFSGIYANFFVLENLIVPGDAVATANNLAANEMLFRFGMLSFVIMVIFDLVLAWALYVLFRPVNQSLSLFAAWLRLVNGAIFAVALYQLFSVLPLLSGAAYLQVFTAGQLALQEMLLLNAFNNTWLIGLIFFGLHLFVLGYLIVKSGIVPRLLGALLIIASLGYLTDSFANILLVNYADYKEIFLLIVAVPGVIGELSFSLWLLFKGVNVE
jgi:hypothetical protein